MRVWSFAILAVPLFVSACALTPRQQCEAPYRSQLRTVEADIADTRAALSRGFTLVPATDTFGLHYCVDTFDMVGLCSADDGLAMFDKRPIVRQAEQAKLDVLMSERRRLSASIAQCAAQYPE